MKANFCKLCEKRDEGFDCWAKSYEIVSSTAGFSVAALAP